MQKSEVTNEDESQILFSDIPEGSQGNRERVSCPINDASSDDEIEIVKPKKILTDRQKETLLKAREKRTENIKRIREEKEQKRQEEEKAKEEKIVKKAIAIKKKQIKKEKIVELTPEEEEIYEEPIKAQVRKVNPPPRNPVKQPEPVKPRIMFI